MSAGPVTIDRRQLVAASAALNGVDFVEVAPDRVQLRVHFINAVAIRGSLGVPAATITGGESIPSVPVVPVDGATAWSADSQGRPVLALSVPAPGDASIYRLTIVSDRLDPFFDAVPLRFGGADATSQDCATPAAVCPSPETEQVPIDYLAKDFGSLRRALSEFSTLRYPGWVERSEADVGIVLMEALAAIGDELSYYQDRVSAEATLQTATQRLSVARHARLVDYEPTPAAVATTVLALDVATPRAGTGWQIDTALRFQALGADGTAVAFEVEDPATGLAGAEAGAAPAWTIVDSRWNRSALLPYWWDDAVRCLRTGSSELYVRGAGLGLYAGQQLLLDTPAADSADPATRELITVADTGETSDVLRGGIALTRVELQAPTTADHDLASTQLAGNIVPAVQGARRSESFTIPAPGAASPAPVVVRLAANSTPEDPLPDYRYCLADGPLAWLAAPVSEEFSATPVAPEIIVGATAAGAPPTADPNPWQYARWLLDAGPADPAFTLTPERYAPVPAGQAAGFMDYDGDGGTTIRFGDGRFGASPPSGTRFDVIYRVGGGAAGNVPAGTIVTVAPGQTQASIVSACTNPFAATGGQDAETVAQVRSRAPQRFPGQARRVVSTADYAAAAQTVAWVQQAGARTRWTGSWMTVVTNADPTSTEEPTAAQLRALTDLLNRRRMAGSESYVLAPRYVSLDVRIDVAGLASAFAGDVASAVVAALAPGTLADGTPGFFDHSRWGFGQSLEPTALLAAVQACSGVAGVLDVSYRQRESGPGFVALTRPLTCAPDQILRVDNDPSRPEAGSLQVTVTGSK